MRAQLTGAALLAALVVASGFLLRRAGKPHNAPVLALHKIAGAVAAVLLGIALHRQVPAPVGVAAATVAALSFAGAVANGALLTLERLMPPRVETLHNLTAAATLLTGIAAVFMV